MACPLGVVAIKNSSPAYWMTVGGAGFMLSPIAHVTL
jgi:hypothetical protein